MSTSISVAPASEALGRLETSSPRYTRIALDLDNTPLSLGNQYLLIALPLGSVQIDRPRDLLAQFVRERFALAGIRADIVAPTQSADLKLRLGELSLSAYDLLITRRLVAQVDLVVETLAGGTLVLHQSATELRQFGFEPQLKPLLVEALRSVCDRLVELAPTRIS